MSDLLVPLAVASDAEQESILKQSCEQKRPADEPRHGLKAFPH